MTAQRPATTKSRADACPEGNLFYRIFVFPPVRWAAQCFVVFGIAFLVWYAIANTNAGTFRPQEALVEARRVAKEFATLKPGMTEAEIQKLLLLTDTQETVSIVEHILHSNYRQLHSTPTFGGSFRGRQQKSYFISSIIRDPPVHMPGEPNGDFEFRKSLYHKKARQSGFVIGLSYDEKRQLIGAIALGCSHVEEEVTQNRWWSDDYLGTTILREAGVPVIFTIEN